MKAQIEEILKENLSIIQCGYMNSQADLDGVKEAAEIIEQFMCYREVRAYWDCLTRIFHKDAVGDHISKKLKPDYPESMITAAIEQVKTESK
jgi:hypothetical protein